MPYHPFTLAFSGKGGDGKTTISSLLIRVFIDLGKVPVLAVDADPNATLHEARGFTVYESLGSIGKKHLPVTFPPA